MPCLRTVSDEPHGLLGIINKSLCRSIGSTIEELEASNAEASEEISPLVAYVLSLSWPGRSGTIEHGPTRGIRRKSRHETHLSAIGIEKAKGSLRLGRSRQSTGKEPT